MKFPTCNHYRKNHEGTYWKTLGSCYGCGSHDHQMRDFSKRLRVVAKSSSSQGALRRITVKSRLKALGKAYVMQAKGDAKTPDVITSNFSFFEISIHVTSFFLTQFLGPSNGIPHSLPKQL